MSKSQAKELLERQVLKLAAEGYGVLRRRILEEQSVLAYEVATQNGLQYQIEINIMWDSLQDGPIRILGTIDDKSLLSAIRPVSFDVIVGDE